jgi:hypothetical protein
MQLLHEEPIEAVDKMVYSTRILQGIRGTNIDLYAVALPWPGTPFIGSEDLVATVLLFNLFNQSIHVRHSDLPFVRLSNK